MQLGFLGLTSVEPITLGLSRQFSEIFTLVQFFKNRKYEMSDLKVFANFAYFRLIVIGPLLSVPEGFITVRW